MSATIRPLTLGDESVFQAHFTRHCDESGRDEPYFTPYAPGSGDGPRGLVPAALELPTTAPGWQRWFAAFVDDETRIVGHVDLKGDRLRTGLHRCELGIGIERDHRGRGLGRRLMATAIDFARASDSLDWIDLKVFGHNTPARALYRAMGFREIGTLPDRFRIGTTSIDDVLMTLEVAGQR